MGLTIHYTLKSAVPSPEKARELVAWLRSLPLDLPLEQVGDLVEYAGRIATTRRTNQTIRTAGC